MLEHQLGQFDSWEIITENIARKTCDKSFFKYHGSGVPQGIRWFFNIEKLMRGYLIAKTETFANNPFGEFVRKDIPSLFYKTGLIDKDKYLITGTPTEGRSLRIESWIKDARIAMSVTQKEMAELTNLSQRTISNLETRR